MITNRPEKGSGLIRINKKIPALVLSGGKLSEFDGNVKEYRVWVHSKKGDDYYIRGTDFIKLYKQRLKLLREKSYLEVEPIIAVVYDEEKENYREVIIDNDECWI